MDIKCWCGYKPPVVTWHVRMDDTIGGPVLWVMVGSTRWAGYGPTGDDWTWALKEAVTDTVFAEEAVANESHYPAGDPENGPAHRVGPACPSCGGEADHQPAECEAEQIRQCYGCGRMAAVSDASMPNWTSRMVDGDPGDPEVGPRPDVFEADFCPDCSVPPPVVPAPAAPARPTAPDRPSRCSCCGDRPPIGRIVVSAADGTVVIDQHMCSFCIEGLHCASDVDVDALTAAAREVGWIEG